MKKALTIAGSDSGGGAGIQADLKTFAALGVHGSSAITALTAQNTIAVTGVHNVPPEFVQKQIKAILDDIGADTIKIGMLSNTEIIGTVASSIRKHHFKNVILDPVMVAASGGKLLQDDAIDALKKELIPLATLITPNLPEAEVLLDHPIKTVEDMKKSSKELLKLHCKAVLLKGGHLEGKKVVDVFTDGKKEFIVEHEKLPKEGHGTGCTLSSAIAAYLALGSSLEESVRKAIAYVIGALEHGYPVGKKNVVLNHFWMK